MELRGKRVLITGASRGIGEAFAHAFTGAGATVALVARTEDSLRAQVPVQRVARLREHCGSVSRGAVEFGLMQRAETKCPSRFVDTAGHVTSALSSSPGISCPQRCAALCQTKSPADSHLSNTHRYQLAASSIAAHQFSALILTATASPRF
jgi:NAD(P)-dependent dehydrogenase (short-subunit alcohol dehydrogenase family)